VSQRMRFGNRAATRSVLNRVAARPGTLLA
jgi:hypothetical protein